MINNILFQHFREWINTHLPNNSIGEKEFSLLQDIKLYFLENKTHELNNYLFNKLHEKEKQKLLGITYTPETIRIELVKNTLNTLKKFKKIKEIRVCDPCCGSGLFNLTLIDFFIDNNISFESSIEKNIFFSDIDEMSVALSLTNLYAYALNKNIDPTTLKPNCRVIDYFDAQENYDAFITNPPYVKLQNINIEKRNYLKNRYLDIYAGSMGLSLFFLNKMMDDLSKDGVLGLITQNNFFTSNSGEKLRKKIQNHILKIDHFGSKMIFDDVAAYSCLLYASKKKSEYIEYRNVKKLEDISKNPSQIEISSLDSSKWRLGNYTERLELSIFETKGKPLGSACRIWVGIATQLDKAFTVFLQNNLWFGFDYFGNQVEVEKEIVKPLIKISSIKSNDDLISNNRGVIFPYKIVDDKPTVISLTEMYDKFPKSTKLLASWKHQLIKRDKGRIPPESWYRWGRTQSMIPVNKKLLTKTFNSGPRFFLDETDSFFSNGYAITVKDKSYDIEFVKEVLNSKIFYYYAKLSSFEIEGGYQCYQKNFIERFCLPIIDINKQQEIINKKNIDDFLFEYYKISRDKVIKFIEL
jgi:methylase of polypeptide subunit release factors